MTEYVVCPECNARNNLNSLECTNCGADLPRTDYDNDINNDTEDMHAETKAFRICDCGAKNPSSARKCFSCNEDISDIIPTTDGDDSCVGFSLEELSGAYSYCLPEEGEVVIGREAEMGNYISDKGYVSRKHAVFTVREGKLFITNLSKTNFTFVNNVRIPNDTHVELMIGDEIGLGGNANGGCRQESALYLVVKGK